MNPEAEFLVEDSNHLAYPDYSYWTIGYILNQSGARKLLDANPLTNLLPVDEFIPIMYDKHPKYVLEYHHLTYSTHVLDGLSQFCVYRFFPSLSILDTTGSYTSKTEI